MSRRVKGGRKRTYLEDEGRKLESSDHSVRVDVRHVLVREDDVVLARAVVCL